MRRTAKILSIFISFFILNSCEPGNDLQVNGEVKISFSLPNGYVEIDSGITGGYYFHIGVICDLKNPIEVHSNMFSVHINNEDVDFEFRDVGKKPEIFELIGKDTIFLGIQRDFQLGDVIEVTSSPGAVTCNGEYLNISKLTVVIDELNTGEKGIIPWLREQWSKED